MTKPRGCPHKIISASTVKGYYARTIHCIGHDETIRMQRRKCRICGRTFSVQPEGLSPYQRFEHTIYRIAASLKHPLQTTLRSGLYLLFESLKIPVKSHVTLWNWIKEAGKMVKRFILGEHQETGSEAVCVDEIYTKTEGLRTYVLVCAIPGGKIQDIESSEDKALGTLKVFVKKQYERGARILVSDGNKSYMTIADELGMKHQLCTFHIDMDMARLVNDIIRSLEKEAQKIAKEKGRRPYKEVGHELEMIMQKQDDWRWIKREMRRLLNSECIWDVYEQLNVILENKNQFPQLRNLYDLFTVNFDRVFLYLFEDCPKTNNAAEQVGRFFKPFYRQMKTFHAYGKEQKHLDMFKTWFDNHVYGQGKNKGMSPNELCGHSKEDWLELVSFC